MVIICGPDGSGKSALIEQLGYERRVVKALRGGVGESEQGNWGGEDEAPTAYARQILAAHSQVAFDRFHLSETIYGPMLRGASGITGHEVIILQRLLRARGIPTIVCLPPYLTTFENVQKAGRERPVYQTEEFLRTAYDRWTDLVHAQEHQVIHYDYTQEKSLKDFLLRHESTIGAPTRCPEGVIGSPTAKVLFVCEQSRQSLDTPFFSMYGTAGDFNHFLWDAGFDEHDLAFTPALSSVGREGMFYERDIVVPRGIRVIVALGAHVAAACSVGHSATSDPQTAPLGSREGGGPPVVILPDPRYWSRQFRCEEYVAQLQVIKGMVT